MRERAAVVLVAGLLIGVLSAQQQPVPSASAPPPVTFRAEVNYVEVDAFVTDQQGHNVTDLTQNDFEIRENGKPQTVASFSLVNIPIEKPEPPLFAGQVIESDVQTNAHADGRIYLIVLDDLHTTASNAPRVKTAVRRFIEQDFGINDVAAVVFTGGRTVDAQDFTNNSRLLLAAIDRFSGQKLPSATIERIQNLSNSTGLPRDKDDDASERARRARSALATIRRLVEFMGNVRGRRKAMLLVSEGPEYDLNDVVGIDPRSSRINPRRNDPPSAATDVLQESRDAIAAATRGNVSIYTLDPRGLRPDGEDLIQVSSVFDTRPDGPGLRSLQEEQRTAQGTLVDLAASTGGFAAVNTNDLNGAFDRIVRENSTYYLIGYYPTDERRDGTFRTIDVRVKRPGLTVRSRKGYGAPTGKAAAIVPPPPGPRGPTVADALSSPVPIAGVPMRVYASAFKDTPRMAAIPIVLELDASNFTFVQQNGLYNDKVDVAYAAKGTNSKIYSRRGTVSLALKPDSYERVRAGGLRLIAQASLPPGRYQLRVAAGDLGGKAGSVSYDLEVPDFAKAPLALSGIALTSQTAGQMISRLAASNDWLKDFLPGPVTATRDFQAGDVLTVFGEVYENTHDSAHLIDIKTDLLTEGSQVIRTVGGQISSSELERKNGGYGFTARLSLDDVKPGLYLIHVQAQSRAGSQPMVSRDVEIRVR